MAKYYITQMYEILITRLKTRQIRPHNDRLDKHGLSSHTFG